MGDVGRRVLDIDECGQILKYLLWTPSQMFSFSSFSVRIFLLRLYLEKPRQALILNVYLTSNLSFQSKYIVHIKSSSRKNQVQVGSVKLIEHQQTECMLGSLSTYGYLEKKLINLRKFQSCAFSLYCGCGFLFS